MEIASAGGRIVHLLAGIVHLLNAGCLRSWGAQREKMWVCKPFHFCGGKREDVAPLLGCDSFTVLLYVVANFFHDLSDTRDRCAGCCSFCPVGTMGSCGFPVRRPGAATLRL